MAHLVNPIVQRLGGTLVLIVAGRQTGQPRSVPLGRPIEDDAIHYLVAGGGETKWVRNLRAAGRGQLRFHGVTTRSHRGRLPSEAGPDRRGVLSAASGAGGSSSLPSRADGVACDVWAN